MSATENPHRSAGSGRSVEGSAGGGQGGHPRPPAADGPARGGMVRDRVAERAEAKKTSRAGRDLPLAILSGVAMGGAVLASLLIYKLAFAIIVIVAVVGAIYEVGVALKSRGLNVALPPAIVGGLAMSFLAYVDGTRGLVFALVTTVIALLLFRVVEGHGIAATRDVFAGTFAVIWVPFMAAFAMLLLAQDDGALRVLVFLLVPICNDIGGYAAGVLFGKHPIAPSISPKKSWEGFTGSLIFGTVIAVVGVTFLLDGPWWVGMILGPTVVVIATIGDFSESLLKRDLGLKDMGRLLPGHGGIMDRLDSLLFAAPTTFFLLNALL